MNNLNKLDLNILPSGIIPTEVQHYVLMAAVSNFEVAKHNWELLKDYLKIDSNNLIKNGSTTLAQIYDRLDHGSNRLLPMVYKNLQNLDDPLLQSIKSFYRYTWAKNHHFYQEFKNIAKKCSEFKIDVTMLKGLSTAFYYAEDPAIRVMEDIDIFIDPKKINLFDKICKSEFNSKLSSYRFQKFFNVRHAALCIINNNEVDIHWSLSYENPAWNVGSEVDPFMKINNEPNAFVLSPDYAFFHAIIHGIKPNFIPTIRWITDCYLIQKKHQVDWDKIISLAIKLNYVESIRVAVEVLPIYGIVIPKYVPQYIQSLKIDQDRVNCWLKSKDFIKQERSIGRKILDNLELIYLEYKSHHKSIIVSFMALHVKSIELLRKSIFRS